MNKMSRMVDEQQIVLIVNSLQSFRGGKLGEERRVYRQFRGYTGPTVQHCEKD